MFTQFRVHYPKGSLITEFLATDHGKYIVRCLVQVEGTTLVTGLAAAETVELAEDRARSRALALLALDGTTATREKETPPATRELLEPLASTPVAPAALSDAPSVTVPTLSENLGQTQPTPPLVFSEVPATSEISGLSSIDSMREEVAAQVAKMPLVAEEIPFSDDFASGSVETSPEVEAPLWTTEKIPQTQLDDVPVTSYSESEPETETDELPSDSPPIDFSEVIARTNVELKRLGWTNQQGRDYLVQTYGKRSRQLLTDAELLDFLRHLESEPTPA